MTTTQHAAVFRGVEEALSYEQVFFVGFDSRGSRSLLRAALACMQTITELFPKFRFEATLGLDNHYDLMKSGYLRASDVFNPVLPVGAVMRSLLANRRTHRTVDSVDLVSQRWRGRDAPISARFGNAPSGMPSVGRRYPTQLYLDLCPAACATQAERCRELVERTAAAVVRRGGCEHAFVDVADDREAAGWTTYIGVSMVEGSRSLQQRVHMEAGSRCHGKVRGVYWGMLFLPAMLGTWDADGSYRALFDRWVVKARAAGEAAQRRIDAGQGTREDWLAVEDVPYRISYPTAKGEACLFCFSQTPLTWTALSKVTDPLSGFGMKHFRGNMPLAVEMHKRLRQSGVLL